MIFSNNPSTQVESGNGCRSRCAHASGVSRGRRHSRLFAVGLLSVLWTLVATVGPALTASQTETQSEPSSGATAAPWVEGKKGLLYRDLVVGEGDEARPGMRVTVHYTGRLPDGTVFDTTKDDNQLFGFKLGDGRVIRGWELGIRGMRVGGVRQLKIPAKLAYGKRGIEGRIPPNTDLEFEIELHAASR